MKASPTTTPDDEQENTAGLKARQRTLEDHFHMPVVLVFPALKAYRRDRRKDLLLQENGYLVLRFLAEDIGIHLDEVLDAIERALTNRS